MRMNDKSFLAYPATAAYLVSQSLAGVNGSEVEARTKNGDQLNLYVTVNERYSNFDICDTIGLEKT